MRNELVERCLLPLICPFFHKFHKARLVLEMGVLRREIRGEASDVGSAIGKLVVLVFPFSCGKHSC